MKTDFRKINPCGGCCDDCGFRKSGECRGCRDSKGKCVKLWSNGCRIYECCEKHNVYFCGDCDEFPCEWIVNKIGEWDKQGIEKLKMLREDKKRSAGLNTIKRAFK